MTDLFRTFRNKTINVKPTSFSFTTKQFQYCVNYVAIRNNPDVANLKRINPDYRVKHVPGTVFIPHYHLDVHAKTSRVPRGTSRN